ncbi:hypothetical protein GCM10023206_06580 [Acinetobacter puyangensis]|uniref:Uncharacterized protein n=1 Tax=Acinetobacter puyangensis TaxID=1096779 RepID=A0A240E670_9GAMM|nr:hypothetical protein [Acinetobacter puyangensis]SNX44264.1 hypothetical protein SAMN05421731_102425 [Acinetobacter puyangensis]
MEIQGNILDEFLKRLITSPASKEAIQSLLEAFEEVVKIRKCLPNFDIPYDDITEFIYQYNGDINIDDLESLMGQVEKLCIKKFPNDSSNKHPTHKCFYKFKQHIYLATTQKNYIQKISEDASKIAKQAEKDATYAKKQAGKAKKLTQGMVANYVSILGIFATIIITVFGGINLISSTVKLLEDNSRLSFLVFVVSFLMACLLTLVRMLTTWISSINRFEEKDETTLNEKEISIKAVWTWFTNTLGNIVNWSLYTKAMLFLGILIIGSLICIICNSNAVFHKNGFTEFDDMKKVHNQSTTGINININPEEKKNAP